MATLKLSSREFNIETVTLVTERGMSRSQGARDMGIDVQTVRKCVKQLAREGAQAFPGQGHPRDDEMVRLRRENDRLRQERDILKKARGIFSRMPAYVTNTSVWQTMRATTQ